MRKNTKQGGRPVEQKEFDQRMIDIARVTRVMAGGKRMRFRACVAIGDHKGRCGIGVAKGADVTLAVNKAVSKAQKTMVRVPIVNETIPHTVELKHGAAHLLLKPAPIGTGVKAGGALRQVLELAGVPNISAKILGTNNKINNVQTLIQAFGMFKPSAVLAAQNKEAQKKNAPAAPVTETKDAPAADADKKAAVKPKKTTKKATDSKEQQA